jgi:hypothetical protein
VDVATRIFFLRMVDECLHVALHRAIAAGGVGIEATARLHREISGLLHRLHRAIAGRLEDDCPLATDPRDDRGPVFVVVSQPGLAFLTTPPWPAPQRFLPTLFRLPLVASSLVQVIGFDRALSLAVHLIGQGGVAQPPAPPIACADMHPHLSGNTPRRIGEAQQKGGQNPIR